MVYFLSESLVMSDVTVKLLWVPWVTRGSDSINVWWGQGVCLPEPLVLIGLVGWLVGFRQSWPPPMVMELHCPLWVKFPSLNSHRQMTWVRPKMNFLLNNWAQSSSLSECYTCWWFRLKTDSSQLWELSEAEISWPGAGLDGSGKMPALQEGSACVCVCVRGLAVGCSSPVGFPRQTSGMCPHYFLLYV